MSTLIILKSVLCLAYVTMPGNNGSINYAIGDPILLIMLEWMTFGHNYIKLILALLPYVYDVYTIPIWFESPYNFMFLIPLLTNGINCDNYIIDA